MNTVRNNSTVAVGASHMARGGKADSAAFVGYLRIPTVSLLLAIICVAGFSRLAQGKTVEVPYVLEVVHPFVIYAREESEGSIHRDLSRTSDGGYREVIVSVRKYALWRGIIVGRTAIGFFVFHATRARNEPDPSTCLTVTYDEQEWRALLRSNGIPETIPLLDPDEVAAQREPEEIRPWQCRWMQGFLGLTDEDWGFCVMFSAAIICFLMGTLLGHMRTQWVLAGGVGLASVVAGPLIIGGGGPAAGVALFMWPPLCIVALAAGRWIRRQGNAGTEH